MLSIPSTRSSPQDVFRLKKAFFITLGFVILLWAIEVTKFLTGINTVELGVYPGELFGLIGIITAPLLHGSFEHLITNTPALLVLGTAFLYGYPRSCWIVLTIIWLLTELGVWCTARPVYHFGASGLAYGIMAFVFVIGILRRDRLAIALSLLVFFLYGTMIWGVFPHQPGVSYETHLWGAGLGGLCAVLFRNYDPTPPAKRYDWEDEDYDAEDPFKSEAWGETNNDVETNDRYE